MKVCVLQPDYSSSTVDYRHYDPPRDLSPLLPGHTVDHVLLDKRTTHAQLKRLSTDGYDIFVNLCEGYLDWDVPSIDVIDSLERLGLPYTGPTHALYDVALPGAARAHGLALHAGTALSAVREARARGRQPGHRRALAGAR